VVKKVLNTALQWAWWAAVAVLPISSFPLVAAVAHSSSVAGLSLPFVAFLALFFFLPYVYRGGILPAASKPLLLFTAWAVMVTAVSWLAWVPAFKGIPPLNGNIQAIGTLVVGLCVYLVTGAWVDDKRKMRITYAILNASGLVMMLWCAVQAAAWFYMRQPDYPLWMHNVQDIFSLGKLYWQRVTAFALEPSWLAHMLNMVFIPYWLAATTRRFSAFSWRLWKISAENILLLGGIVTLTLTFSRVGLISFFLMLAYLFIRLNVRLVSWIEARVKRIASGKDFSRAGRAGVWAGLMLVYVGLVAGGVFVLVRFDARMADVFNFNIPNDNVVLRYADRLHFGERVAYWQAGWGIFNDHPFIGVGLGNAGYYLPQKLPGYGQFMVEVRDLLYRGNGLLNIKSMWVRLLAETGWVGFVLFAVWLWLTWKLSSVNQDDPDPLLGTAALAGCFAVLAFLWEGFSIDSFALPYLWFSTGMAAAAYLVFRNTRLNAEKNE
jgi:O-antigen ligase